MPFSNLLGNEPAKAYLSSLLEQNRLPNTLLFHGIDGVGKKQFAIALAKKLMGPAHTARIDSGNHPDLHFYAPEGKSGMHSIASMRELMNQVAMAPFEAKAKVFILEDAERMLPTSSNALLKTLEEPPLDTYIILLSHEPESILPTLLSRSRKVSFFPISEQEIVSFLEKQEKIPLEDAHRIALFSQGSLAKALFLAKEGTDPKRQLLREILNQKIYEDYPSLLKALAKLDDGDASEEEGSSRMKQIDALFEEILFWFRDRYLSTHGVKGSFLLHTEQSNIEPIELAFLTRIYQLVAESRLAIQRNIKLKVVLEHFFLKAFR
jgi:DNA polymerase-3 subunit delta'